MFSGLTPILAEGQMFTNYKKLIFILFFSSYISISHGHPASHQQDNWNAEQYIKNSQADQNFAQSLLSDIDLKGNENILDIGCGDGRITLELAKKVPKGNVIGIDPSDSMINKARKLTQNTDLDNIHFIQGNAETFAINEKFDIIVAIHVMHWIKNQKQAFHNIFDHLTSNGKVYLMMAPAKEDLPFERALKNAVALHKQDFTNFKNPMYFYDMETYRKLMVESGFHIDQICYTFHEEEFLNKQDFSNWLKQWLPHYKFLPLDKKEVFLKDLIDSYLSQSSTKHNGKIKWGEYILKVEATKRF